MKELTDKSFSDALYDCYNTPNSQIMIVFGSYKQVHDFAHSLRMNPIYGADVSVTQEFDTFREDMRIRFRNGSSIRLIHFSELSIVGVRCDEILMSHDLCRNDDALAFAARYERPEAYKIRKGLSYKQGVPHEEAPPEPDTEALDAFLSEFSIVKS